MCSDAPNTDGINAAALQNAEIGREQLALAREAAADNKVRQAEFDPIFKNLLSSSIAAQDTATKQSADQWASYKDTWQPLEKKMADTAANFDTPERRAAAASQAAADMGKNYGASRAALTTDLARTGASVTGGKALALRAASDFNEVKDTAGAENTARRQIEQAGISLVDNAARFGRNMTSTGLQTAQLALGAGQNAGGLMGQQQSVVNAGLGGVQGLYGGAANSTASAGSMLGNIASLEQQTNAANQSTMGSLAGAGITAGAILL